MPRAVNSFLLLLPLLIAATASTAAPAATAPATAPAAPPAQIGFVHGSGDSYWITLSERIDKTYQTAVYQRSSAGKWEAIAPPFYGRVTSLADYQGDLVAVLADGSWRTIYNGGSTTGTDPPDNAKVIALAGDGDVLRGIIQNKDGYFLANLSLGKWTVDSKLPDIAQLGDRALLAMGVVDHEIIVASRTLDRRVAVFSSRQQSWDSLGVIVPVESIDEITVLPMGRQIGVWVSPGFTNGGSVYMDPPNWKKRIDMGPDPGEAAVASERLRLMYIGKEKGAPVIMEKQWDFNGRPLPAQKIMLPEPDLFTPYISWGMWAVFGIIVLLVLMRRSKDEAPPDES